MGSTRNHQSRKSPSKVKTVPSICVRLGDLHPLFEAWCAAVGSTPAEMLKQLVSEVTAGNRIPVGAQSSVGEITGGYGRIRVSVGEQREAYQAWCQSMGLPQSAALRWLVATKLAAWIASQAQGNGGLNDRDAASSQEMPPVVPCVGAVDQVYERDRLRLRLSHSEMQSLKTLAAIRNVNASRLATQVVRAYMLQASVLSPQTEVDLGAINLSLMRIGANLNQIAKHLNANVGAGTDEPRSDFSAAMADEVTRSVQMIQEHVKAVAKTLDVSRQRWRIEVRA